MASAVGKKKRKTKRSKVDIDELADKDPEGNPKEEKLPAPGHGKLGADSYTP